MATTRGSKPSQIAPPLVGLHDFSRGTDTAMTRGLPVPGTLFQTQIPDEVTVPMAPFLAKNRREADKARGYTILPDGSIGDITK